MSKKGSVKDLILEILKENEGKIVYTKDLDERCRPLSSDWPRSLRRLRGEVQ